MEYIVKSLQQHINSSIYHKMADRDEINWIETNEPWRLEEKGKEVVLTNTKWFEELVNVKGIGLETAKDIGMMFKDEEDFINGLINDRVPLRNDKVKLLKEYFNLNSQGGNK